MAETSQSVHCMQCRTVRSLACVRMSWRAEPSVSKTKTVSCKVLTVTVYLKDALKVQGDMGR